MSGIIELKTPYLLFLGDAADALAAKTAQGVAHWRPEWSLGQLRLPGCNADLGLKDMTLQEAYDAGARTLVVGVANRGGVISAAWVKVFLEALDVGFDIAAGLHNRLADIPELAARAKELGRTLSDVRHPKGTLPVGDGKKRPGKRLLPVGTDCSCGKMYTALSFEKEMKRRGMKASFRATGQTGILIAGGGISVDAVVADFIAGATEVLAPANDADHWDLVEGQGSLFHASYAGVSTGLLHGAQPDVLILCHEPTRTHMRGLPHYPIPDLAECMRLNLEMARLTNPSVKFAGICINTSLMNKADIGPYLASLEDKFGLPAVDPFSMGVGKIVDTL